MPIDHAAARFVNADGTMTQAWHDAMKELGICSNCGSVLDADDNCDNCEVPKNHYHVVEFINGCLNDYDSGPIDELIDAQTLLDEMVHQHNGFTSEGEDKYLANGVLRYERGLYILKVEECSETDCEVE